MLYLVLFRDDAGTVFSVTTIEAEGDRLAIETARTILSCGIGCGYEIRRDNRHVHTEPPHSVRMSSKPPPREEPVSATARAAGPAAESAQVRVLRDQSPSPREGDLACAGGAEPPDIRRSA